MRLAFVTHHAMLIVVPISMLNCAFRLALRLREARVYSPWLNTIWQPRSYAVVHGLTVTIGRSRYAILWPFGTGMNRGPIDDFLQQTAFMRESNASPQIVGNSELTCQSP